MLTAFAFCALFAVPLLSVPGDISLGLIVGSGFLLNSPAYLPGVIDEGGGFDFEAKGQYLLADDFLLGADLHIGALTGFMKVNRYTDASGRYGRGDIPLVAFGQLDFGPMYALAGVGLHLWTGDGRGMDFGMTLGGGYLYELSEDFTLDAGVRLHALFADNAAMLNWNIGVVYSF
jgi:opacity protein-like surface antigen